MRRPVTQAKPARGQPLPDCSTKVQRLSSFWASRWALLLACGVLVLAALIVYGNSFSVPFLLDDECAITDNPTIWHLWPLGRVLSPPGGGITVSGRPLVNLTLAVNYALGGTAVWGYHALNLGVHILAGLTLLGIVRRTLVLNPALRDRFGGAALPLGLVVALLWVVHPLQTGSVTYIVQRAESLMGLFYLLTLYCFIRGTESGAKWWQALAVVFCLLGMATKEVMVSAPLMVLLYDRTFVAGTFQGALRQRWRVYAGLGGSWLLLAYLVAYGGQSGSGGAGFHITVTVWSYALTQLWAIPHYLWLTVWPQPLVFDYGTLVVRGATQVLPPALVVALLVGGTVVSLWRWPVMGFLGCWFLGILAPTSSVLALAGQTVSEHRMYLPLVVVVAPLVLGVYARVGRGSLVLWVAVAAVSGLLTLRRNEDYRSEEALWRDTVTKEADNSRAHNNFGNALRGKGQIDEAIRQFQEAIRLKPDFTRAYNNLGAALLEKGQIDEAISQFQERVRLKPDDADAHNNLGTALDKKGQMDEAIRQYQEAIRLKPDHADAHNNLGAALDEKGQSDEAIRQLQEAIRLKPDHAEAHNNLGIALGKQGQTDAAIHQFQEAVRVKPGYADAHYDLGVALGKKGQTDAAIRELQEALRLKPDYAEAHNNLGGILFNKGQINEAIHQFQEALRLKPGYAEARKNLDAALATQTRSSQPPGTPTNR
jgi:Flp pilus assembly protein TadD